MVNTEDDNAYDVPHMSAQLAEYLKEQFSTDSQIAQGLLSDPQVVRSESYLLGFLAGLGFARQVVTVTIDNQQAFAEEADTMTRDVDINSSWLDRT